MSLRLMAWSLVMWTAGAGHVAAQPDAWVADRRHEARALYEQGQPEQAATIYEQVLRELEQKSTGTLDVAHALDDLATAYLAAGRHDDVDPLIKQSLIIKRKLLAGDDPDIARSLHSQGTLYAIRRQYDKAESVLTEALSMLERDPDERAQVPTLRSLARVHVDRGREAKAEPLYQRVLGITERVSGVSHPDVALALDDLCVLYQRMGRVDDALPLYRRALEIVRTAAGDDRIRLLPVLDHYAGMFRELTLFDQAKAIEDMAAKIRMTPDAPLTETPPTQPGPATP